MPKAFRFATLKRVRELREKQEQREFANRHRDIREIDENILRLEAEKGEVLDLADRERRERLDIHRDFLIHRYLIGLRMKKGDAQIELQKAEEKLETQRKIMMRSMRERKMMDRLLEKHEEEERLNDAREETIRLSEVAILRFGRKAP